MFEENKTAIIVDPFNNYNIRTKYVKHCLNELHYSVTILMSNFSHGTKRFVEKAIDKDTILIDTPAYYKNLSLRRINSHRVFSKRVYKFIKKNKPDVIYCILPPNSLAKYISRYKKKNKSCKIFFDVFDLWPESLPAPQRIKQLLFTWKNLRNANLHMAEMVITECNLYKRYLPKKIKTETVYLCKGRQFVDINPDMKQLEVLYLGSINNIIDIEGIVLFLSNVNKRRKVNLHIIGGGECSEIFMQKISHVGVEIVNHGMVYDEEIKTEIIAKCHFGLNMYKRGLCIGLTMKSIDYFSRGLPVVTRNIFDTEQIVKKYNCGIALNGENIEQAINKLVDMNQCEWQTMKNNAIEVYNRLFSVEVVVEKLMTNFKEYLS